ncbi:MocR-like pyridoxine biosynthesis transcription factor PdxR [Actinocatenispora rupis]|uniref:GntR family transcriptional regulator n=1 Tax=Actinocatenispora rupis TaxID=519421 RepID=A0A8J3NBK3_9ACTN|nr:PLP-dependent aminotransferase family protein [Actinocatenispora rupis]GID13161.1 GntR family transcriptional regulator [Actinocatenispora rupis]
MADQWSIAGVDLYVDLDATRRRGAALTAALRDAVRSGRLAPGTRLPASRTLAADLGIARGTVTEAYRQLAAEGYLVARQGAGTVVAPRGTPPARAGRPARGHTRPPVRYDLRPGLPDLSAFPRRDWLAATRTALGRMDHAALGWGDPRGHPTLRTELAAYAGRVRGVQTEPGQVMVCAGFAHGLALLCAVLRDRGIDTLAVEDPYLPGYRRIAEAAGLRTVGVPVDADGIVVDALRDVRAVVVTPAHQFPMGVPLAPDRRMALLDWARAVDGLVIEDDYDGEFRYDRQPVGALQGLDPDRVVYAGTASKTLAPGLRLGWLALPSDLVDPLTDRRDTTDRHTGILDQLTFAELVATGAYDRHVRRSRARYRRRRDHLVAALAALPHPPTVTGIAAGLHALVALPPGYRESAVVAAGQRRSLGLTGLSTYRGDRVVRQPQLVLGYGTPPDHAYGPAVRELCAVLTSGG